MQDFLYVGGFILFFVLAGGFVFACDKLIGPDDESLSLGEAAPPAPQPEGELGEVAA